MDHRRHRLITLIALAGTLYGCGAAALPTARSTTTSAPATSGVEPREAPATTPQPPTSEPARSPTQAGATSTAPEAATPSPAPQKAGSQLESATATLEPRAESTSTPPCEVTPAPISRAQSRALYVCDAGLCIGALDGSASQTVVTFDPTRQGLAGYALSADGAEVVYGSWTGDIPGQAADLFIVDLQGGAPRQLLHVTGIPNGLGELQG